MRSCCSRHSVWSRLGPWPRSLLGTTRFPKRFRAKLRHCLIVPHVLLLSKSKPLGTRDHFGTMRLQLTISRMTPATRLATLVLGAYKDFRRPGSGMPPLPTCRPGHLAGASFMPGYAPGEPPSIFRGGCAWGVQYSGMLASALSYRLSWSDPGLYRPQSPCHGHAEFLRRSSPSPPSCPSAGVEGSGRSRNSHETLAPSLATRSDALFERRL